METVEAKLIINSQIKAKILITKWGT